MRRTPQSLLVTPLLLLAGLFVISVLAVCCLPNGRASAAHGLCPIPHATPADCGGRP